MTELKGAGQYITCYAMCDDIGMHSIQNPSLRANLVQLEQ